MNNYEYCAQWIVDNSTGGHARVLDFGCGAGQIVDELRKRGIEAFGCDVFYEGGDYSSAIHSDLLGSVIKKIEDGRIPFPSDYFDFVVNNQVMEHVENLNVVLSEISRVLKPGGVVLSLFPDRSVWREGHCGIPFLHWFPKGSRTRVYFAAGLRAVGFGHHKGAKSIIRWSEEFCEWLDKWTWYRNSSEIRDAFDTYFIDPRHLEDDWMNRRYATRYPMVSSMPTIIKRGVVRKLAGRVFAARKPLQSHDRSRVPDGQLDIPVRAS